jgi:PAS domain S-box-containing protein
MLSTPGLHPETFLHAVLDNVGVALLAIDSKGRFVFTNQAALNMFGWAEGLGGVSLEEWRRGYVFRDGRGRPIPAEQAPIMRALAGEEVPPQDMDVTLPDGRRKWLHAAGHHFSVFGMTGVFVIVTDETEQIWLRRAFEQARTTEVFGLLVRGLVHDMNNMLSVISGSIALLRADERVPETGQAQLEQMTVAAKRGAALTKRLARYSRTQELQLRAVQINDLVNVVLEVVHPLLKDRVSVKTELGFVPAVEVDPSRIEQALLNLILNALDAMPEGGELTLCTALVERLAAEEVESDEDEEKPTTPFVCVTVADTGIGIPEKLQSNIFDPFFTTKPDGKGSGLGLASAHAIVRQHNGFINVQSTPGAGAKFNIYLPAKKNVH